MCTSPNAHLSECSLASLPPPWEKLPKSESNAFNPRVAERIQVSYCDDPWTAAVCSTNAPLRTLRLEFCPGMLLQVPKWTCAVGFKIFTISNCDINWTIGFYILKVITVYIIPYIPVERFFLFLFRHVCSHTFSPRAETAPKYCTQSAQTQFPDK